MWSTNNISSMGTPSEWYLVFLPYVETILVSVDCSRKPTYSDAISGRITLNSRDGGIWNSNVWNMFDFDRKGWWLLLVGRRRSFYLKLNCHIIDCCFMVWVRYNIWSFWWILFFAYTWYINAYLSQRIRKMFVEVLGDRICTDNKTSLKLRSLSNDLMLCEWLWVKWWMVLAVSWSCGTNCANIRRWEWVHNPNFLCPDKKERKHVLLGRMQSASIFGWNSAIHPNCCSSLIWCWCCCNWFVCVN